MPNPDSQNEQLTVQRTDDQLLLVRTHQPAREATPDPHPFVRLSIPVVALHDGPVDLTGFQNMATAEGRKNDGVAFARAGARGRRGFAYYVAVGDMEIFGDCINVERGQPLTVVWQHMMDSAWDLTYAFFAANDPEGFLVLFPEQWPKTSFHAPHVLSLCDRTSEMEAEVRFMHPYDPIFLPDFKRATLFVRAGQETTAKENDLIERGMAAVTYMGQRPRANRFTIHETLHS